MSNSRIVATTLACKYISDPRRFLLFNSDKLLSRRECRIMANQSCGAKKRDKQTNKHREQENENVGMIESKKERS